MIFTKRKVASTDAQNQPKKLRVVSVRLTEEEYQQVVENCRKSGRELSDFWRRALLNAKITALATPEDMAILRQIGSMSNNLNQLATVANRTKEFKLVSWELQARSKELKTLYNNLSNDWKITKGSDFGGCVRYALAVDEPGKEARLLYAEGVLCDTPQDIINGFECQRHLNQRVQHWVGHISLSYSPEDSAILTDEKMVKFALEYMERMGIKNTQFIIARHLDKEHPHCHIVFNRVDNDGKCVSDSCEYFRSNDICKELKLKYGLTFGKGRDKVKTNLLKGHDRAKQEVYIAVRYALKVAKDWTTFQRELARSGVSLRKKYRRGTTIVEGLSFVKGKYKFKASEVAKGRKFSFANIDRILNENKNDRSQTASTSSPAPRPVVAKAPKQEPSIASKVIEAGLEIGENLAEGLGGLFKLGPGYDPEQEAMNNEIERRRKKAKRKGRSI